MILDGAATGQRRGQLRGRRRQYEQRPLVVPVPVRAAITLRA